MKKRILALCVVISVVLGAVLNVSAEYDQDKHSQMFIDYLDLQIKTGSNYVIKTAGNELSVFDLLLLSKTGADLSSYKDNFINSIKAELIENKSILYYGNENLGYTAAVIDLIKYFGFETDNFEGFNLIEIFEHSDSTVILENPYDYRYAIEFAVKNGLSEEIIDNLTKGLLSFYTLDKGMNYWGYSADNTAMFLVALELVKDRYLKEFENALKVLSSYKVNGGYYYSSNYGVDANSNSTANALLALSLARNLNGASVAYKNLVENFESDTTGIFTYDDEENFYSTKDALQAVLCFKNLAVENGLDFHISTPKTLKKATCEQEGLKVRECKICGEVLEEMIINKLTHQEKRVGKKSATYFEKGHTGKVICSVCGKVIHKGKSVAKKALAKPKFELVAAKKSFKIKYKKVKDSSGFEVQYRIKGKIRFSKKSFNTQKSLTKTIKSLKQNKKYEVRIRSFVKKNGKTAFSDLTKAKTVKVK